MVWCFGFPCLLDVFAIRVWSCVEIMLVPVIFRVFVLWFVSFGVFPSIRWSFVCSSVRVLGSHSVRCAGRRIWLHIFLQSGAVGGTFTFTAMHLRFFRVQRPGLPRPPWCFLMFQEFGQYGQFVVPFLSCSVSPVHVAVSPVVLGRFGESPKDHTIQR